METLEKIATALNCYETHRLHNKQFYERNKERICEERRKKYREANPNPKPRGRPKKLPEPILCECCKKVISS
jgi:hypothetical protein